MWSCADFWGKSLKNQRKTILFNLTIVKWVQGWLLRGNLPTRHAVSLTMRIEILKSQLAARFAMENEFQSDFWEIFTRRGAKPHAQCTQPPGRNSVVYIRIYVYIYSYIYIHCNTLQHTAAHCSTLQHTATHLHAPALSSERRAREFLKSQLYTQFTSQI